MTSVNPLAPQCHEKLLPFFRNNVQDYWQIKMDMNLKGILGEKDFEPFEKRYEWVKKA